ncbi:MAG: methyltransferase domain-containing protein [Eggerthellales bacterium]|nr:methyltransferase domain-containing protein [Eggerthellales bacterium]
MSSWTPEIISYMADASRTSNYFARLSEIALRDLPAGSRVCDAGCGMGQLSLEMARAGMQVDAFDCSPQAIAYLTNSLGEASLSPGRVRPSLTDFTRTPLEPGRFDRMVFSLSAAAVDAFDCGRKHGARSLVVINKMHPAPAQGDEDRPIVYNLEKAVGHLCSLGLRTSATDVTLSLDQPFSSIESARRFFSLFRTRAYPHGITDTQLRSELTATENPEFPYVLPVKRHLAVFRITMPQDLPTHQSHQAEAVLNAFFSLQGGANRTTAGRRRGAIKETP